MATPPPAPARPTAAPAGGGQSPAAPAAEGASAGLKQASAADKERARRELQQAEEAHARGFYGEEGAYCRTAADLVKDSIDVESIALRKVARQRAARARILECLWKHVTPNEFADGKNLTKIVFEDHEYIVRITSQTDDSAVMRLASGVELNLAVADIKKVQPCRPEEWRARVEKGLEERRAKADDQSALELYQLAYYCLENGIGEKAPPFLDKALAADGDNVLVATFCSDGPGAPTEEEVRLAGLKGPALRAPAPAPETGAASGEPAARSEAPLHADPAYTHLLARVEDGRVHYRASFGSTKKAEDELKAASAIFDEVFGLVQQLQAKFPDSDELAGRLTEINMVRADCHKRTKVAR
jgi:hypothetical protein